MSDFGDPTLPTPSAPPPSVAPPTVPPPLPIPPPFNPTLPPPIPAPHYVDPQQALSDNRPDGTAPKSPRPPVVAGSVLIIVGAAMMIVGSFLTWFSLDVGLGGSESFNGFASDGGDMRDGPVFVFLAVVVGGLGLALLLARKVLAVAIIAVVFASFSIMAALADISDVSDAKDTLGVFGGALKWGPGLWVILVGTLVALGGSIAALAKRRR